ncbi:MAG: hypothetical protein RMJ98_05235 [Myxococcales bacterium]|nr:hypothetical protein [Polyangiaceae bacterium]MDW8248693.1 hypothetical protein [Myxococcales bacterium]
MVRRGSILARSAVMLALLMGSAGCNRKPFDATPEGVVREFLERLERVHGDPKDARAVFDLLSRPAQTSLSDRSRRASAAFGKRLGPEQMIAPSHYFPRFQPRQWTTRIQGNHATVELIGLDPTTERAAVPCVNEEGHWRIDLSLPPLPPIERRPGSERH